MNSGIYRMRNLYLLNIFLRLLLLYWTPIHLYLCNIFLGLFLLYWIPIHLYLCNMFLGLFLLYGIPIHLYLLCIFVGLFLPYFFYIVPSIHSNLHSSAFCWLVDQLNKKIFGLVLVNVIHHALPSFRSGQIFFLSQKMRSVLKHMQKYISNFFWNFLVNKIFILSFWDLIQKPDS